MRKFKSISLKGNSKKSTHMIPIFIDINRNEKIVLVLIGEINVTC